VGRLDRKGRRGYQSRLTDDEDRPATHEDSAEGQSEGAQTAGLGCYTSIVNTFGTGSQVRKMVSLSLWTIDYGEKNSLYRDTTHVCVVRE